MVGIAVAVGAKGAVGAIDIDLQAGGQIVDGGGEIAQFLDGELEAPRPLAPGAMKAPGSFNDGDGEGGPDSAGSSSLGMTGYGTAAPGSGRSAGSCAARSGITGAA